MKRFKLCVSIALAIAMVCSMLSLGVQAAFTDVPYNHACLDGINYAVDNGILLPTSSTQFSPNTNVTRAQVVYALYKESRDTGTYSTNTGFNDVSSTAYYASAITWARQKGIAGGTSANGFSPNVYVKRQDLAVFIYRYANYMEHDTYVPSSFDLEDEGYTDLADIASYATEAVTWSVYNGIIRGTSATGFAPNAYMARKWFANVLAYYSQNVEGFVFEADSYSFANSKNAFTRSQACGRYYVSPSDTQRLEDTINAFSGENSTYLSNVLSFLNDSFDDTNGDGIPDFAGSCFGMSITTVLDKTGKINVNYRASDATGTLRSIVSPVNYSAVESAINYYQVIHRADLLYHPYNPPSTFMVNQLLTQLDTDGFAVMKFLYPYTTTDSEGNLIQKSGGHAIVLFGYESKAVEGEYEIYAYDNRYPGTSIVLDLVENGIGTKFTLTRPNGTVDNITDWWVYDPSVFEPYDIDGYDNKGTFSQNTSTSLLLTNEVKSELISDEDMYLFVGADDFTLENSKGEKLSFDLGVFSGDLEVLDKSLIVTDGQSVEWCLKVHKDDYTVYPKYDDPVYFNLLTSEECFGISGSRIDSITLKENGQMSAVGDDFEYCAKRYIGSEDKVYVKYNGRSEDSIDCVVQNSGELKISGSSNMSVFVHSSKD